MDPSEIVRRFQPVGGPARATRRMLTRQEASQRFRAAIEHANITNEYAAMRAGIHASRISEYINGARIPSWERLYYLIMTIPLDPRFFFHEILGSPPSAVKSPRILGTGPGMLGRHHTRKDLVKEVEPGPRLEMELVPDHRNLILVCSYLGKDAILREISQKAPDVHWTEKFQGDRLCPEYESNRHYFFEFEAQ